MIRGVLLAFALGACGGKVVFDEGVIASTTTSASSSSGGSDVCPSNMPTADSPCATPAGMACDYGDCCPNVFTCVDGKWSKSAAPCPTSCPPSLPASGSACMCETTTCHYSEDAGATQATCENGAWTLM